ncbi:MAG: signal transduction histidine kinase, LytS [Bacteroidetes bacterium]|nr:signal transduction histidine kinase, LytS [Bacteroidota bacterium]
MCLKTTSLNIVFILLLNATQVFAQKDYNSIYLRLKKGDTVGVYQNLSENNLFSNSPKNDLRMQPGTLGPKDTVQRFYYYVSKALLENARTERNSLVLMNLLTAFQLAKSTQKKDLLFVIYNELSDYYIKNYDFVKSMRYCNLAKSVYQNNNEEEFLQIIYKIAKINGENFNTELAIEQLNKIVNVLNHGKDNPNLRAHVYQGLGAMLLRQRKIESARDYYKKAYLIYETLNDTLGMTRSLLGYGSIESVKGTDNLRNGKPAESKRNFTDALEEFQKAETMLQHFGKRDDIRFGVMIYMCDTYINLSDIDKAQKLAEQVYQESIQAKKMRITVDACMMLTEIYNARKDFEKAFKYNTRFVILRDSLMNLDRSHDLMMQTIGFEFNQRLSEDSLKHISEKQKLEHALKLKEANHRTFAIIFIGIVLITAILSAFYLYAVKKKKQEQKMEYERKLSEARITTLLAQINPHFVFNSLNSILSFIQSSNREDAIKYLTKFSRIIRLVLESSEKQTVSVHDEVSLLRLYIELEQLRYNHLFDFDIQVNSNIDKFNTEIPVMMLQPFIENALIHGIQNKLRLSKELNYDYRGELLVKYQQNDSKIICTVRDNGIGRKKSAEFKSENVFNYRSLGIKFTEKRLQLLSKNECRIVYKDLLDNHTNEPAGTEVTIELPILN